MSFVYGLLFVLGIFMLMPFSFSFLNLILQGIDDVLNKRPSETSQLAVSFLMFVIGFLIMVNVL